MEMQLVTDEKVCIFIAEAHCIPWIKERLISASRRVILRSGSRTDKKKNRVVMR